MNRWAPRDRGPGYLPCSSAQFNGGNGIWIYGCHIGVDMSGSIDKGNGQGGIWIGGGSGGNLIGTNNDGVNDAAERNIISGNGASGILIGVDDNVIAGNYIGLGIDGSTALSNNAGIFFYAGDGNIVGGEDAAQRNVVSGNLNGVFLVNPAVTNTKILGNYIGTDATGAGDAGNTANGIVLTGASSQTTIGGVTAGARNVISGNDFAGINMSNSSSNQVLGNYIGTNAAGTAGMGNTFNGVLMQSASNSNTVGGPGGAQNVISDNRFVGINLISASDNQILNNLIGTDAAGTSPLGNAGGIFVQANANNNIVDGNVMAAAPGGGIGIGIGGSTNTTVKNNWIGTNSAGAANLGNGGHGVRVSSSGNHIGPNNTIARNGGNGVLIDGGTATNVSQNAIFLNGLIGIDLSLNNGVTVNDPGDFDNGTNNLQNNPRFDNARLLANGNIEVTYNVNSNAGNSAYPLAIEFYLSDGGGEGKTLLATDSYTTPIALRTVQFAPLAPVNVGDELTATATDNNGNTSEFSTITVVQTTITQQPQSLTVCAPAMASFSVTATGSGNTYQWRRNGVDLVNGGAISGANSPTLTINPTATSNSGTYDVIVSGVQSDPATLTVNQAPAITQQPANATTCPGVPVSFTSAAGGTPAPAVQWQVDPPGPTSWSNIMGATSTTYTIASPTASTNGNQYRAVFTNSCGSATSNPATLTVNASPTLTATASPSSIWPPNKKMHDITVTLSTSGSCSPVSIVLDQITSDESATGFYSDASFNTTPADVAFKLKADRDGNGDGRVYTIRYKMTYNIGNNQTATSYATTTVSVPHDQGNGKGAVPELVQESSTLLLEQNVPNPFDRSTEIAFRLAASGEVVLKVYTMAGQEVATLAGGVMEAGSHMVIWNGTGADGLPLPSGVYLYRIVAGSEVITRSMVLRR